MGNTTTFILVLGFFFQQLAYASRCDEFHSRKNEIANSSFSLQQLMKRPEVNNADIVYLGEHHLHSFNRTLFELAAAFFSQNKPGANICFFFEIDRAASSSPYPRFVPMENAVKNLGFIPVYVDSVPELPEWIENFSTISSQLEEGSPEYKEYIRRANEWAISSIQPRDEAIAQYIYELMSGKKPVCDRAIGLIGGAHLSYEVQVENRISLTDLLKRRRFDVISVNLVEKSTFLSSTGLGYPSTYAGNLAAAKGLHKECTGKSVDSNLPAEVVEHFEDSFDFTIFTNQQ